MANKHQIFKWKKTQLPRLTSEKVTQIESSVATMDRDNHNRSKYYQTERMKLLRIADVIWGSLSSEFKAIKRQKLPPIPDNQRELKRFLRAWDTYVSTENARERTRQRRKELRVQRQNDDAARKQQQNEYQRDRRLRAKGCASMLESMGYVEGEDFELNNAITMLKQKLNTGNYSAPFPLTDPVTPLQTDESESGD